MNPIRRCFVNGLILTVLGLTLVSVALHREVWPICTYPMFKELNLRNDRDLLVFFVVTGKNESPLTRQDFSQLNLKDSLPVVVSDRGTSTEKAKGFLNVVLADMQRRKELTGNASPPPTGLRGYLIHYHYPNAGNFAPQMVSKRLYIEVGNSAP